MPRTSRPRSMLATLTYESHTTVVAIASTIDSATWIAIRAF